MRKKDISLNNPVIIIANGDFPTHPIPIKYIENSKTIICTDGAADKLISFGRSPDFVIGDFDSTSIIINDRPGKWIETPNQNKTDLEKTIEWCIKNQIININILGCGGNREDHMIGNLFCLSKYYDQIKCKIITNESEIICYSGENLIDVKMNQQISIIATELIDDITIDGLKYNIKNEILKPSARAICNESISKQFYLKSSGKVLVFFNHK
tara:strand:+ start:50 stop:685 length:636 start_codon:yes stop_codon:yes gene_type:complete